MIAEFRGKYRFLSNFYKVVIYHDGIPYPSVEHAYQSAKCDDQEWKEYCSNPNVTCAEVKQKAKTVNLRPDWEKIKQRIMYQCLYQKFSREPFRTKLLQTGNSYLQEGNHWDDSYWGFDLKLNKGENILGRLLMKIRHFIRYNIAPPIENIYIN